MPREFFGSNTPQNQAAQANQIWEQRQRARDAVEESFDTVSDPDRIPIENREGGLGAAPEFLSWAEPQEVAHDLDQEVPEYDVGVGDVQETGGGWGLTPQAERGATAAQFDADIPEYDVGPDDVHETDTGWGLTPTAERGVAAERFEADTPLEEVDPQDDIRRTDEGFELTDSVLEENSGLFF